jgi:hypothetical protein
MAEQLAGRLNEWLQHVQLLINSSGPAAPRAPPTSRCGTGEPGAPEE